MSSANHLGLYGNTLPIKMAKGVTDLMEDLQTRVHQKKTSTNKTLTVGQRKSNQAKHRLNHRLQIQIQKKTWKA